MRGKSDARHYPETGTSAGMREMRELAEMGGTEGMRGTERGMKAMPLVVVLPLPADLLLRLLEIGTARGNGDRTARASLGEGRIRHHLVAEGTILLRPEGRGTTPPPRGGRGMMIRLPVSGMTPHRPGGRETIPLHREGSGMIPLRPGARGMTRLPQGGTGTIRLLLDVRGTVPPLLVLAGETTLPLPVALRDHLPIADLHLRSDLADIPLRLPLTAVDPVLVS